MTTYSDAGSSIVRLNIGGAEFGTTIDTLTRREPESMLAAMFSGRHAVCKDSDKGYVFVDRDGTHFRHILNWLRDGIVPNLSKLERLELLHEAKYYQLLGLVDKINEVLKDEGMGTDLTRTDIIKCLQVSVKVKVILRGVNLSGLDLSKLHLSGVDFSLGCLKGVNFSHANLHRANFQGVDAENAIFHNALLCECDFIGANLRGALFGGATLKHAHLQDACLKDCSFYCADLRSAFLLKADLTNANLEGANLQGANLADATLNNVNVKGANFRYVCLCYANLRDTLLEGTNLEGANLTGVIR